MSTEPQIVFESDSIEATDHLGAILVSAIPDAMTVALCGTLGAGKTRLVQSMAEAIGVSRGTVVSPTFVLMQQYSAQRTLIHLDAYRLCDDDEFLELGPEEFFAAPAITLIEWADRVETCLPSDRLIVEIEITGQNARRFRVSSTGTRSADVVRALGESRESRPKTEN